jgi:predicted dehydrogenase
MKRPRLGFVGVGWIGQQRLNAMIEAEACEVVGILDPSALHVEQCLAIVPHAAVFESLDEVLAAKIDGVVIATPSALHAGQTIAALERGLPVFCQKPLARTADEVRHMIGVAKRTDRLLGVDLSYRYTDALQKIRELVRSGALGKIFGIELVFHNAYGPQAPWFYDARLSGGGCVIDLGIHLIDAALWILETPIRGVSSRILSGGESLSRRSDAVEDFAMARLDFADGAVAQLSCSWRLHAGRDAVIEAAFYGTQGGAAMRNVCGSFLDFRAEHFVGTKSEVLAEPPDAWGGRAAVAWARQLAQSPAFDPAIKQQIEVAVALDAIHAEKSDAVLFNELLQ